MALIKCPECGHEVSDKASSCPNCGYPIRSAENPVLPDEPEKPELSKEPSAETAAENVIEPILHETPAPAKLPSDGENYMSRGKKKDHRAAAIIIAIIAILSVIAIVKTVNEQKAESARKAADRATSASASSSQTSSSQSSSSASSYSSQTTGEKNALKSAKSYLDIMSFSYKGLIDQLKFEGYTDSEAKYAADNCGANWKEQAKKSAKAYLDTMSFSKQGLIEQLEYEGFTHDQAVYGVNQVWD